MSTANLSSSSITIVGNNYHRYGTSVFEQLYSESQQSNSRLHASFLLDTDDEEGHIARTASPAVSLTSTDTVMRHSPALDSSSSLLIKPVSPVKLKKQKYSSLISTSSKVIKKKLKADLSSIHLDSDSFSLFSSKSSASLTAQSPVQSSTKPLSTSISNPSEIVSCSGTSAVVSHPKLTFRKLQRDDPFKTINDLPVEILVNVIQMIDRHNNGSQKVLLALLSINKNFYTSTKLVLYQYPKFNSTYRLAQFVTSIRQNPENGLLVKTLDLSSLKPGLVTTSSAVTTPITSDDELSPINSANSNSSTNVASSSANLKIDNDIAYAGWRDWRLRTDPLYSSPLLNTMNLKRVSSNTNNSSVSNSTSNSSTPKRNRSSSVTSFMSSLHPSISHSENILGSATPSSSSPSSVSPTTPNNSNTPLKRSISNTTPLSKTTSSSSLTSNTSKTWSNLRSTLKNKYQKNKQLSSPMPSPVLTQSSTFSNSRSNSPPNSRSTRSSHATRSRNSSISTTATAITTTTATTVSTRARAHSASSRRSSVSTNINNSNSNSTAHPYCNKYLLKYASYCDIPVGYILHLLQSCPNLINLNLSNVALANDFRIVSKRNIKPTNDAMTKDSQSSLPTLREFEQSTSTLKKLNNLRNLDVIYLTDSSKDYDYYEKINTSYMNKHKNLLTTPTTMRRNSNASLEQTSPERWIKSTHVSSSFTISPVNKRSISTSAIMTSNTQNVTPPYILEKLTGNDIFNSINSLNSLQNIHIESTVWCRSLIIKNFIFNQLLNLTSNSSSVLENYSYLDNNDNLSITNDKYFNFKKSGLNRHLNWATKGHFIDFIALIVLDELENLDDLDLEDLFSIKRARDPLNHLQLLKYLQKKNSKHNSKYRSTDIIESSEKFNISFDRQIALPTSSTSNESNNCNSDSNSEKQTIEFQLIVVNSSHRTRIEIKKIDNLKYVLIVKLCNRQRRDFEISAHRKIDRSTRRILSRIKELMSDDLRRNLGGNNYLMTI
ncbi:hypothetical protein TBLA_0H03550 [Henningerozyma blattae CBS 6284]|uniref:Uncharacterized protein n=1 Tax=Henningerozyma blattae (strain ATCC 34711 / CBS 6284 / DSM 70876 / NBRC 10599 / NRRL Y-10934 / UCD 77-7) TaxID=1071380 RepID=I2H8D4_HENB6|nr:hypothetical protein TBLA_0H03550 [Tetrapisispora blattae CBS 6284]CCH62636.1 hypothetical protein TBLA_0H03550 [Tetrapisispora blattae CBS 6284]